MTEGLVGAVVAIVGIALWTWWRDVASDVTWDAFWLPVRDTSLHGKPWLRVHVAAHLVGGALIALGLLSVRITTLGGTPLNAEVWQRALWLLPFQILWERIQHENWKRKRGSSDYPWWSAVWDVQVTFAGWALVEGGRVLVARIF